LLIMVVVVLPEIGVRSGEWPKHPSSAFHRAFAPRQLWGRAFEKICPRHNQVLQV
jgi:hypothetical protein